MAYISVTNTFANKTRTDSSQVNKNFKDITDGLSDGTKDINVNKITAPTLNTTDLDVVNMTVTTDFNITNKEQFRINLYTQGFPYYCFKYPSILDLELTDAALIGFKSGFYYGKYAYFIPNGNSKIARVNLNDFSTVDSLDLSVVDVDLNGFIGAFTDGQYGYCVPHNNGGYFGKFVRFLLSDFTDATVDVLNLEITHPDLIGFRGGCTDGKYAYLISSNKQKTCRIDLSDFSTTRIIDFSSSTNVYMFNDGVYIYSASYLGGDISKIRMSDFIIHSVLANESSVDYGCTDGRYGYFYSGANDQLTRIDLHDGTKKDHIHLTAYNAGLVNMGGLFYDGRYIYIAPNDTGDKGLSARVDTHDFYSVEVCDFTQVSATAKGYENCFTDGYWGYFIPYYNGISAHGKVARILLQ